MEKLRAGGLRLVLTAIAACALCSTFAAPALSQGNASIAGRVWLDRDGNALPDAGELGFPSVIVDLLDDLGAPVQAASTDLDGNFAFTNLASGTYTVRVDTLGLPQGTVQTFDLDMVLDDETQVGLAVDQTLTGVDLGYQGTGSVGDTVYLDLDADGIQTPGEDGIDGALLTVTDGGAQVVATVASSPTGFYSVGGLPAGNYTVAVDPASVPGLNPASDPDGMADHQTSVTLAAGESRADLDFGYNGDGILGDRLYLDLDSDGLEEPGEPGIVDAGVELLDDLGSVLTSTTTAAGGLYQFTGLPAGDYTVRVDAATLPVGVSPTGDLDGTADGQTALTLGTGEVRDDLDFGYAGTASAGDLVFFDLDGDGFQGAGEDGIAGVTLNLTDLATGEVATVSTDAAGFYTFGGLPVRSFDLAVDTLTLPAGANPASDPDGMLDNETFFTSSNGEARTDLDFGYNGNGSLGDRVFLDDGDGVEGPGDTGLEAVDVQLLDDVGTPLATATTDVAGGYSFGNLLAGTYTVRVIDTTLPPGSTQSVDPDGFLDHETTVALAAGEMRSDLDFGYLGDGEIAGRVWDDQNGDAIDDGFEPGLPGVSVTLFDGQAMTVGVVTTDGGGFFSFPGVPADNYTLLVDDTSLPTNYTQTFDSDGLSTPHSIDLAIAPGEFNGDSRFGYIGPGEISGRVWDDQNGDAIDDGFEPGLPGVAVTLFDGQAMTVGVVTTDGGGFFQFDTLLPDNYTLLVDDTSLPTNYTQTFDSDGLSTPHSIDLAIAPGEFNGDSRFGYIGPGEISGRVWDDQNGDAIDDGFEPGLPGVAVTLFDGQAMTVGVVTTDDGGFFQFDTLLPDNYTLLVDDTSLPTNYTQTFDSDGLSTPHSVDLAIAPGEFNGDSRFGYIGPGEISGRVWDDQNGDTIDDGFEPGLPGVAVTLFDGQALTVGVVTTDGGGFFQFDTLLPDNYTLLVDDTSLPTNYTQTFDSDGLSTPHSVDLAIAPGEFNGDSRFGYIGPGEISGRVWDDQNGDTIDDGFEPGLPGVAVTLFDGQALTVGVVTTDGGGFFQFDTLLPDNYTLLVDDTSLPTNYTQTFDSDGLSTPHSIDLAIAPGEFNGDSRFGYIGPGEISGRVWDDQNGDGVEDGPEPGLPGVAVTLFDGQSMTVAVVTTDGSGFFQFDTLLPDNYTLFVDDTSLPAGYGPTFDSDGLSTPHSIDLAIAPGEFNGASRFGYAVLGCQSDPECDDGLFCNGAETCDVGTGECLAGTPVVCDDGVGCTADSCNEAFDACDAAPSDAACDNGLFCDGAEFCDPVFDCQAGADPCSAGESCNESADACELASAARLEWGTVTAGGTPVTVSLANAYVSPVVVTAVRYSNNTLPVVTRISNVTGGGFDVRLQNPSDAAVAAETVDYLVVEEGDWVVDGVAISAHTYTSTVTDENNSWVGEAQAYGQSFTSPVVLGQVMSSNDPDWSVFWDQGASRTSPPSATALRTGKTVCEDADVTRAAETVGYVVIEPGHGTLGGIEFEAALGGDTVRGVTNSPPYTYAFNTVFGSTPAVAVVTMAGMDGGNGGWAYVHGASPVTPSTLDLSIDEDQVKDGERKHTTEQVGYLVFATAGSISP